MKDNTGKRKILSDRKYPSAEQIAKHQNFERLQKDYSVVKKLLMKKILLWSGAILGVVGITSLVLINRPHNNPMLSKTEVKSESQVESYIQPPVPGMETPFTTYRISAKDGGVIHYSTGSSITIPPNAFSKEDGKVLSDSVDVKYREFHDALAIFLSGIPMNYDSAGIKNTLESAGMLEILAFDNGKNLRLNEQAPIQIKMASKTDEERFNLYKLDTIHKNWIYKGRDKVEKVSDNNRSEKKKQQTTTRQFDESPATTPVLANPEKFSFKITYDKKEFPELAAYENVVFEVTDQNFKPSYFKINWNKISLYSSERKGEYLVKLKKADTTITVTAKPVFEKNDYAAAMAKFETLHKEVSMNRDQQEFEKQATLNQVNKSLSTNNVNKLIAAAQTMVGIASYRNFAIVSLGVHNCDYPIPPILQYAYSFRKTNKASQTNSNEEFAEKFTYSTIFLVEKGKNTVFRFAKGEPVRCNPAAKNLMWTMTDKNQVAFFRITDYTQLLNGKENNIDPVVAKNQDLAFEEIKKFSD